MIKVLDSTLREGEQTPGVYFDRHIKLAIARLLDEIGIDIIETGHPTVTEDIRSAVHNIAHSKLNAIVAAHSRSVKSDIDQALDCGVSFIGIFIVLVMKDYRQYSKRFGCGDPTNHRCD